MNTMAEQNEIVIADMMRAKNKQSFFALYQIQSKIKTLYPDAHLEFHILWDEVYEGNVDGSEKWTNLIDTKIDNLYSYNKEFFDRYVEDYYFQGYVEKFHTWKAIYHILMGHYMRRVLLKHYYLIYDDDILINDDFKFICDLLIQQIPVMISEPMNANCDKVMYPILCKMFGPQFDITYKERNPYIFGFNAGFQGIDLSIYDFFLSKISFKMLLDLFNYKSIYNEDGMQMWGDERFMIDTQQQSFMSLMNTVVSRRVPYILNPNEYFIIPNWGEHPKWGEISGWDHALESKITHFIGHTHGQGKPKEFLDRVDEYLKQNNFL